MIMIDNDNGNDNNSNYYYDCYSYSYAYMYVVNNYWSRVRKQDLRFESSSEPDLGRLRYRTQDSCNRPTLPAASVTTFLLCSNYV